MKRLIDCNNQEVREHFLKGVSYSSLDIPDYFDFDPLLKKIAELLGQNLVNEKDSSGDFQKIDKSENVNFKVLANKDGQYGWRAFELIHPVIYVSLVNLITKEENWTAICQKFKEFSANKNIRCISHPLVPASTRNKFRKENILNWWTYTEQESIRLGLKYNNLIHTDISDCYGSIYTHSISWALHTREIAKEKRGIFTLFGNNIDRHFQIMHEGQTNGIPQGSIISDFIAEIVLGYADSELSKAIKEKLNIEDYLVLRYRDDYRIFTNGKKDAQDIMQLLSQVCIELGLRLSPEKTNSAENVISGSIKRDKLTWISRNNMYSREAILDLDCAEEIEDDEKYFLGQPKRSLQKTLMKLFLFSQEFPNSGSLMKGLSDTYYTLYNHNNKYLNFKTDTQSLEVLVSIVVEIAYRNPKTYSLCAGLISKLFDMYEDEEDIESTLGQIIKKFEVIPNSEILLVWLHRLTINRLDTRNKFSNSKLVQLAEGGSCELWNNKWIQKKSYKKAFSETDIINREIMNEMSPVIEPSEIALIDWSN